MEEVGGFKPSYTRGKVSYFCACGTGGICMAVARELLSDGVEFDEKESPDATCGKCGFHHYSVSAGQLAQFAMYVAMRIVKNKRMAWEAQRTGRKYYPTIDEIL